MSGGSHDYLYSKPPLPPDELAQMIGELEVHNDFQFAKAELQALLYLANTVYERWQLLENFMLAWEWHRSGDWDLDQVKEAHRKLIEKA